METPFIPHGGTPGDVASMLTEITDRLNAAYGKIFAKTL